MEIKFRIRNKQTGETSYGTLEDIVDKGLDHGVLYEDYTWDMYTGLKDKSGVEIYEGDIISESGAYVLWSKKLACWAYDFKGEEKENNEVPLFHSKEPFQVIGNIHENPELLVEN